LPLTGRAAGKPPKVKKVRRETGHASRKSRKQGKRRRG
jgi:hypothetical protein